MNTPRCVNISFKSEDKTCRYNECSPGDCFSYTLFSSSVSKYVFISLPGMPIGGYQFYNYCSKLVSRDIVLYIGVILYRMILLWYLIAYTVIL